MANDGKITSTFLATVACYLNNLQGQSKWMMSNKCESLKITQLADSTRVSTIAVVNLTSIACKHGSDNKIRLAELKTKTQCNYSSINSISCILPIDVKV